MDNAEFDQLMQISSELNDFFQWLVDEMDKNQEGITRFAPTLGKLNLMLYEIEHKRMLETPPDPSSGKFIDEFRAEVIARGFSLPGKLEKVGGCGLPLPTGANLGFGHYVVWTGNKGNKCTGDIGNSFHGGLDWAQRFSEGGTGGPTRSRSFVIREM